MTYLQQTLATGAKFTAVSDEDGDDWRVSVSYPPPNDSVMNIGRIANYGDHPLLAIRDGGFVGYSSASLMALAHLVDAAHSDAQGQP